MYYHCASHQLNLALNKACSLQSVQCMLSQLQSIKIYFKYSPKRQRCLKTCTALINYWRQQDGKPAIPKLKLKLLSKTRWFERHTAITDFVVIYESVIYSLKVIISGESPAPSMAIQVEADIADPHDLHVFDSKSRIEVNGLFYAFMLCL